MKKIYFIITAAIVTSTMMITSCKKVLLKQDIGSFNAPEVFNDSTVVKLSLDYIYSQNQPQWFGNSGGSIGSGTNICGLTEENYSDNAYVKGTVTAETVTDIGATNTSGNYFKINTINMFIRDVTAGTLPNDVKNRFMSQAYFWRAYRYFELVKLYGGVPLVLAPLPAVGTDAKTAALIPRSKTSETFAQVVNDLDSCIKYLPAKWPQAADYGRITSGAAAAFLGRVLVTYASPEFNPSNDITRWQAAYAANTKAVSILSSNGYALNPTWDFSIWKDGTGTTGNPTNTEAVLVTEFNTFQDSNGQNNNSYTNSALPKYLGTTGGSFTPTYDITLAFPMLDGKAPGVSTKYPYSLATFYKNRDPRFAQTIAYNGCNWATLGNSAYRLWTYYYYTSAIGATAATKSTESSASTTGFYLRKAVDPTISLANITYSGTDWIEIRYAEVLLNLAESAAEIGNLGVGQEAYTGLLAIRKRAGIEAGTDGMYGLTANMTHDQMITAIMNEREVELAFEGKRYWDLRRRKLLETTLNGKTRSAMVILLNNTGTKSDYLLALNTRDAQATSNLDAVYTTYFTVTTKVLDTYNIAYQPADYFFGIPTASINNNINLLQNNTWGGSFDPLQ